MTTPCSEHPDGSVVVGVGLRPGAAPADLAGLVAAALTAAGLHPDGVGTLATLDRRAAEPAVQDLARRHGWTVTACRAEDLDRVPAPGRNDRTRRAVGAGSVAEAAALLAAGPGAALLVPKTTGSGVTVAVARQVTGHSWTGTLECICGR